MGGYGSSMTRSGDFDPTVNEVVTKEQAAKRQIVTAITLYFNGGDYVSMLSLVSAAYTIVRDLNKKRGLNHEDLEALVSINFKEEAHRLVKKKFTDALRFVKHADTDPDAKLELQYSYVEFWLLLAADLYTRVTKDSPVESKAYHFWFASKYPFVIKESPYKQQAIALGAMVKKSNGSKKDYFTAFLMKDQEQKMENRRPATP